jgi:heme A synthase
MKTGVLLFRVTAIVVFLQLIIGGLLTFNFISATPHIVAGFIVFILAIAIMVVALASKPSFRPIRILSIVIVLLLVLQIILGFATLNNGSQVIAFVHFVNAMAILGATISSTFVALRWDGMARAMTASDVGTEKAQKS